MELLLLFSWLRITTCKYLSWDFWYSEAQCDQAFVVLATTTHCDVFRVLWYQLASGVSVLAENLPLSTFVSRAGFLRRSDGMDWLFDGVPKCECNLDGKKQGQITPGILIKKPYIYIRIHIYIYVYIYIYIYLHGQRVEQVKQPWLPPRFPVWPLPSCPGQWATPGLGTKSLVRQWHLPSEGWWVMWAPWLAYLKHDEDEENLSRSLSWRTIRYMWHGCIR